MRADRPILHFHRWFPQTIRARLSFAYAGLFFVAGALLLGLTYGLVASHLPSTTSLSKVGSHERTQLRQACIDAERLSGAKLRGKAPPSSLLTACQKLAAAGANASTATQRSQVLKELLLYSFLGVGVMTIAAGGLGWIMAGRALRPVTAIASAARRASEKHLGERLRLRGPNDELKELADTFDDMLNRLDIAFASQQRFVADASHELRTPLTVMRTAIDVTLAKPERSRDQLDAMASKVRRSVDQAERLIDALLTLSISDQVVLTTDFIDLATIAEDEVDERIGELEDQGLRLALSFESAEAEGNRDLVERLIGNLIDNSVRHNIADGWIHIRTGESEAGAFVQVTNSSATIDETLIPLLFEPFRRISERTEGDGGVGLGLAIVQSIARAHDATLKAEVPVGGGLSISVTFPKPGPSLQF